MISSLDRRGYIGASDTKFVMGNWNTQTFEEWWRRKQGLDTSRFVSIYTETGNAFEHKITDFLGIMDTDQQMIDGHLRVNFDAIQDDEVIEIKTHKIKPNWKPTKDYVQQVQVQMYISKLKTAKIIAYALEDEDYEDWNREIDSNRISFFFYDYDEDFIREYLPRLAYLSQCLEDGKFPRKEGYEGYVNEPQPFT